MAVSTSEPLCLPCDYYGAFKVELQVKRPLMPVQLGPEQVGLEMLCLCGQLDLLIRAQMQQFQEQLGQGCSPEESDTFQAQGSEILDQMLQCLEHLPKPMPQLEDYLDMVGLSAMFPRVEVFLIQGSPVEMLERPLMDEYFFHIAKLNQLLVLSQQLEEDIRHLGSHKYIAHQLSVIYQVISSFRGIQVFSEIKKDIEANFKQMKQSLVIDEGSRHEPQLATQYINWILEITRSLTSAVLSLPEELTEDVHQAVTFVSQIYTLRAVRPRNTTQSGWRCPPYLPGAVCGAEKSRRRSKMSKKLLADVDCGVDDAQAIMLALANPNVELLGITCVHGNTTVENVCKNTLRILQACNRLEIPVFKGAAKPLLGKSIDAGHFHGQDGLGDAPDANAPGLDLVQKEDAVSAIVRIVNENPGEVSLVATAPLTNLAMAVMMDPSLSSKLQGLYIMGGNTESRGNTTVCGEFNFTADPEAASIVLNAYQCPVYLICWEFTCYSKLSWDFCDAWLAQDTDKARFMARIFRHSVEASKSERAKKEFVDGTGFVSCDSYAMAAAVDDSFILESDQYPVTVELTGTYTRGMMVVDTLDLLKKTHKAFIVKKVDMELFKQMMMDALK
ncbi:hypothetical protein INR49_010203 [Caranx melampygus]|nr:hypothetical protein INR49_010203 [Caranx melampygus]